MQRRSHKTNRRISRKKNASHASGSFVKRLFNPDGKRGNATSRRSHGTRRRKQTGFNPLRVAQDILDHNSTIVVYGNTIGVMYPDGDEKLYTSEESRRIINEFHEMFDIAKQATLLCDPLRKRLQELLFVTQPIGLTDARMQEAAQPTKY